MGSICATRSRSLISFLLCASLASCGGSDVRAPVAISSQIGMLEDSSVTGVLQAATKTRAPLRYELSAAPAHGSATVDANTGAYTYTPTQDYFGIDAFRFRAAAGDLVSEPATITVRVSNVNDPPVLFAIGDTTNSSETLASTIALQILDVDGDKLSVRASASDTSIATVEVSGTEHSLFITPAEYGKTQVHVSVGDAEFVSEQTFTFEVRDVTKSRIIEADMAKGDKVTLSNDLSRPVTLTLEHNDFPMFQSDVEIADHVRDMASEYLGEPFERKLWRFVRDSVYHNVPINNDRWLYDPWAVINSQGWGFCGHVAAAFVRVARAAGYEARVWGLSGHVVPEILVDGRWQIYDPDLAVYYLTPEGTVAGLEDLTANPTLISSPSISIFQGSSYDFPYSQVVTNIYATTMDNFLGDSTFIASTPAIYQPLVLPPGAQFSYPGRWTNTLTGVDGTLPYDIAYFLQGKLRVPAGTAGLVVMPWMVWEVRGTGQVSIAGATYEIGSPDLRAAIQSPGRQIENIEIIESTTDLEFIFFVNAMRYGLIGSNSIKITGKDVWAVRVENSSSLIDEDPMTSSSLSPDSFAKPRAVP